MTDEELLAEEHICDGKCQDDITKNYVHCKTCTRIKDFLAGLKAGRPQWHKVVDGDLPKIENRIVLCICIGGYINNEPNYVYKLLTSREFCLFQPVIEWCELPTFDKE